MGYIIDKLKDNIRKYGFLKFLKRACKKIKNVVLEYINNILFYKKYRRQLDNILNENCNKKVIVFYPFFDFNMPNFQRFQQLAIALGSLEDILFFYCTPNNIYDHVYGFKNISNNLYLTNQYNLIVKSEIKNRILYFVSTDVKSSVEDIKRAIDKGDKVIYDYVDDMHEDIIGCINCNQIKKHQFAINNKEVTVLVTADKLLNDVYKTRRDNVYLITNGVNIDDFLLDCKNDYKDKKMDELCNFKDKFKITICYYGAFAKWFDYELLKYIAKDKNIGIILIGVDYDMSLKNSNLLGYDNVLFLGIIEYKKLKYYANKCDIMTIPFVVNEITNATSPVKLFEYMALKKPIITTNIKECCKYKCVEVANSYEEFVKLIYELKHAIESNKFDFKLVLNEAIENSWESKAKQIDKII